MPSILKKRRMIKKQPPLAAYVVKATTKWCSEVPRERLVSSTCLPQEVTSRINSFLRPGVGVDWLGIGWPLNPSYGEPAEITKRWIQQVLHFRTKAALNRNPETKNLLRIIRKASQTWIGQFFGKRRQPESFADACGVLLAIAFNGLPFEGRAAFLHGAFDELIFYSEHNDPNPGPVGLDWFRTNIFIHRTWREILHVAFCVLMHRATDRRTHQALHDSAHFYDAAVAVCDEGEARPFRFYWNAFEKLRSECHLCGRSVAKLRMLVEHFAETEGGRGHGCSRTPLYWRAQRFLEPLIHESRWGGNRGKVRQRRCGGTRGDFCC